MDLEQVYEIIERIGDSENPPTDDELRAARTALRESLDDAIEPGQIDLKAAKALRKSIDTVDSELTERAEQRDAEQAEAAKLLEGLDDPTDDEPVVDPEGGGGDDVPDDGGDGSGDGEREGEQAKEPVAAAMDLRTALSRVRRVAKRGGDDEYDARPRVEVVLSGPAAGEPEPGDYGSAVELFNRKSHLVTRGKQTLLELQWNYPRSRSMTKNAPVNTSLVESLLQPRALAAAGGICDPLPADFTHPICGDRSRPIRDALPRFGADRGGVRFAPAATLGDVEDGVGIWTEATDADPGTAVKDCLVINCEEEVEVKVDAIYRCMQVGNFQARFNPEFWASRLDLLLVAHDRLAEQTLFGTMQGLAADVAVPSVDGNTVQTLFLALDRAAAGIRSRHRLDSTVLRFVAPMWLKAAIRSSLMRGQLHDTDLVAVADATINTFFNTRNIVPTWSPDIDIFGAQNAGALLDWPNDEATTLLFPEGSYFYLDGGTLDLGIEITDSGLNATNDRQAFAETFEQVAFRGCEALELAVPIGEDCVCATTTT